MTREPTAHASLAQGTGSKSKSTVVDRTRRTLPALVGVGIACGLVASLGMDGSGHASQSVGKLAELGRDRRAAGANQQQRVASALDTLQRLPEAVRASLRATKTLASKDVCRIAEKLVLDQATSSIDMVANYLSKDVHRWSDRMITLYLNADPRLAKATDKDEMRKRILQKWESDRGIARRWLQGCGIIARATIGRGLPIIEREGPGLLADVVSVIAIGLRKNEPDAIAAAEALVRAEEALRTSLK
jgi:hypothetical protein